MTTKQQSRNSGNYSQEQLFAAGQGIAALVLCEVVRRRLRGKVAQALVLRGKAEADKGPAAVRRGFRAYAGDALKMIEKKMRESRTKSVL